jgi:hypothetical protein
MYDVNNVTKDTILQSPDSWPWNIVLRLHQFSRKELLAVRDYCDVWDIVRFQSAASYDFIVKYFKGEVDQSDMLDWHDVIVLTRNR